MPSRRSERDSAARAHTGRQAERRRRCKSRPADIIPHVTDHTAEESNRPARSYRVEALAKGLRLLSYFTAERPALHVKDLVALSGIPMPTVFRLVATLTEEGYLERTVDGMVRPGTGVLVLGFAAMQGL